MMKLPQILVLSLCLLMLGCSTARMPLEDSPGVPWSRVLAYKDPLANSPMAIIKVTRDSGFYSSGCYWSFGINERRVARLDVGETATVYVPPGRLILGMAGDDRGEGMCDYFADDWYTYTTTITAGETQHFRLGVGIDPLIWIPLYELLGTSGL